MKGMIIFFTYVIFSFMLFAISHNLKWKVVLVNGSSYISDTLPVLKNRSYEIKIKNKKLILQKALVANIVELNPVKKQIVKKEKKKNEKVFVLTDDTIKRNGKLNSKNKKSNSLNNKILNLIYFEVNNTYRKASSSSSWSSGNIEFTLRNKSNKPIKFLELKFIWYKSGRGERIKENYLFAIREVPLGPKMFFKGKNTCYYNLSDARSISYSVDVYGTVDGHEYFPIKKNIFISSGASNNLEQMQRNKDKIYRKINEVDREIRKLKENISKLETKIKEYEYDPRGYDWKVNNAKKDIERYKLKIDKYEEKKDDLRDELRKAVY